MNTTGTSGTFHTKQRFIQTVTSVYGYLPTQAFPYPAGLLLVCPHRWPRPRPSRPSRSSLDCRLEFCQTPMRAFVLPLLIASCRSSGRHRAVIPRGARPPALSLPQNTGAGYTGAVAAAAAGDWREVWLSPAPPPLASDDAATPPGEALRRGETVLSSCPSSDRYLVVVKAADPYAPHHLYRRDSARPAGCRVARRVSRASRRDRDGRGRQTSSKNRRCARPRRAARDGAPDDELSASARRDGGVRLDPTARALDRRLGAVLLCGSDWKPNKQPSARSEPIQSLQKNAWWWHRVETPTPY